jgi:hypothetical protein
VIESKTSVAITHKLIGFADIQEIGIYWDPVEWGLNSKKVNYIEKKKILNKNKYIIKKFDGILVPSDNMNGYFKNIGAKNVRTIYPYFE